jgi:hypothetical protein
MGVRVQAGWEMILDIDTNKQIEVLIDRFEYNYVPRGVIRIVVIQEPFYNMIFPVMEHPSFYTYVLTYREEILKNNPKARFFLGSNAWVDPNRDRGKKFCVSTVVGGKDRFGFAGYPMRHKLWELQNLITIPRDFYLSSESKFLGGDYGSALVLGYDKEPMFDCQFHIAIQNGWIRNCYSEQLLDCFLTKTIPIHWGTPNISEMGFNMDGIYECETLEHIINTCNSFTPETYRAKLSAVEDNYRLALPKASYGECLRNKIIELISEYDKG